MNDYAAAPIQPIAQGLITIDENGDPNFDGVGISDIIRTPIGAVPPGLLLGDFLLTLDEGLPGDVALESYKARTLITLRGGTGGVTTITQKAVLYPDPIILPAFDEQLPGSQVRIIVSTGGAGTDPIAAAASGIEIVIWRGVQASIPGFSLEVF